MLDSGLGGGSLVVSPHNAGRSLPSRMYIRLPRKPTAQRRPPRCSLLPYGRREDRTDCSLGRCHLRTRSREDLPQVSRGFNKDADIAPATARS
jgi:hypothetical protein